MWRVFMPNFSPFNYTNENEIFFFPLFYLFFRSMFLLWKGPVEKQSQVYIYIYKSGTLLLNRNNVKLR